MAVHTIDYIGASIETLIEAVEGCEAFHKEFKIVANHKGIILDILHYENQNWNSVVNVYNDEVSFKTWLNNLTVDLKDYHPTRHFDKTGDCDFKYLIPLNLF